MWKRLTLLSVLLAVALAMGVATWHRTVRGQLAETSEEADDRLVTAVRRLESQLDQFRRLPRLIADDKEIIEFLQAPTPERTQAIDRILERRADVTGASDIYVMNRHGTTLAASNWRRTLTFKGRNFAFRPYFQRAIQGGLGVYYALGTTSLKRGFYFSSPVYVDDKPSGVVAVKVDLEAVEEGWRSDRDVIYFTDSDGIVFVANRRELLFKATKPIDAARTAEIRASRQYADQEITPLPALKREYFGEHGVIRVANAPFAWRTILQDMEWSMSRELAAPLLDLNAHIQYDASPAFDLADSAGWLGGAVTLTVGVVILLIWQYRANLKERLAMESRANEELELKVTERTDALTQANIALKAEIQERRTAEAELRRAQDELVQASKLSALGQMSAGISHELNQPLIAIRSFAENARIYLERGRDEEARANLGQITELTARMARIIKNLRAFAKKEVDPDAVAVLDIAVIDALSLLERRIEQEGISIDWQRPASNVSVRCGAVRLTQVIVNILNNAIDAMAESERRAVTIRLTEGDMVRLTIADSGPGIAEPARGRLFDPFFTTKSEESGEGLGLGLSISYGIIKGFGGEIRAENAEDGGAVFIIDLVPAEHAAPAREVTG